MIDFTKIEKINEQIEKISNEIKNSKKVFPDFRILELNKLINKRERIFIELQK